MLVAYMTLAGGILLDFEQADDFGTVNIRAGASLSPHERPVILTLTPWEAREVALHLAAFITNAETLAAGAPDPPE